MRAAAMIYTAVVTAGCLAGAWFGADQAVRWLERSTTDAITDALAAGDNDWAKVEANGLHVLLTGTAPTESARARAFETLARLVDTSRIEEQTEVVADADDTVPAFNLEILRSGTDLSLIGVLPGTSARITVLDGFGEHAGNEGVKVHKWHHYLPLYDRYFGQYRGTPVKFLEIGVNNGGSLQMWRRYFGPDAVICGIDINPDCAQYDGQSGMVRIGSQDDPEFLASVIEEMGGIDAVLDDGSHRMGVGARRPTTARHAVAAPGGRRLPGHRGRRWCRNRAAPRRAVGRDRRYPPARAR